jgi:hypothetical protein
MTMRLDQRTRRERYMNQEGRRNFQAEGTYSKVLRRKTLGRLEATERRPE